MGLVNYSYSDICIGAGRYEGDREKVNVFEVNYLKSMASMTRRYKTKNEAICQRTVAGRDGKQR